ncbi:hypothetical protein E4U10_007768, partial [Claviceps purpurea]
KSAYASCLAWNQMGKECTSGSQKRPWTDEEKMAWIDDSRRQDEEAYESAEEEHAANNYSFRHRGLRGIMKKVEARAAAK